MVQEIVGFLPHATKEQFQIDAVIQLIQESREKACIASSVHKMSTTSFIFRPPDLDSHSFCKNMLAELGFSRQRSTAVLNIVVYNVCDLKRFS